MTRSAISPPTCSNMAANESTAAQTAASAPTPAVICLLDGLAQPSVGHQSDLGDEHLGGDSARRLGPRAQPPGDHRDGGGVPLRLGLRVLHGEVRDVAEVDPRLSAG